MANTLLNWKSKTIIFSILFCGTILAQSIDIPLYKVFETSIINGKVYANKFIDVDLTATFTSPSGKSFEFPGFFDGDGKGGGDYQNGTVWKLRFMPNELGNWTYEYYWSDSTIGGSGTFDCIAEGAGKGVLQAYKVNPHWFSYNGTEPVYIKSYYESSMRPFYQPWDCAKNIYQTLIDNGYNYLMVNWLLPSVSGENFTDCLPPSSIKATYNETGKASSTMNLDVWNKMEVLLSWLNDRNVSLFMFLGFDGGRNNKPQAWANLSAKEQDFFARYTVARIAPYAIITWNYVWEVEGDTENGELGCMRLVKKYDVFNHLRTYEDEKPKYNEFSRPEYTFAGVENHRIHSDNREPQYWATPWTHHVACLMGYVPGKPVYMVEGNSLWRRYWAAALVNKAGYHVTQTDVRQAAWACATAAASFTWCGHTSLSLSGSSGLPFFDGQGNPYRESAKVIDILTDVMTKKVVFYRMTPQDSLLSRQDSLTVWCLAEPGSQYLVFVDNGKNFSLDVASGQYDYNLWIDAKTGNEQAMPSVTGGTIINFTPPNTSTDWVLILRTNEVTAVEDKRNSNANQLLKNFELEQNYPNPFNPTTTIQFELPKSGNCSLKVYNLLGQEVASLFNGNKTAGRYNINFDASSLASGIYIYRLSGSNINVVRKMMLMK